jgi:hypothetical protein
VQRVHDGDDLLVQTERVQTQQPGTQQKGRGGAVEAADQGIGKHARLLQLPPAGVVQPEQRREERRERLGGRRLEGDARGVLGASAECADVGADLARQDVIESARAGGDLDHKARLEFDHLIAATGGCLRLEQRRALAQRVQLATPPVAAVGQPLQYRAGDGGRIIAFEQAVQVIRDGNAERQDLAAVVLQVHRH